MRAFVISIAKRFLFGKGVISSFPAMRILESNIEERVILYSQELTEDISKNHCVICHEPFMIAVLTSKEKNQQSAIRIMKGEEILSSAQLHFERRIETDAGFIDLYLIKEPKNFQISSFRQKLFFKFIKDKDNNAQRRNYAALYSYPREVVLISHRETDKVNFFPLDFKLIDEAKQIAIIGLSRNNKALHKIEESGKMVICDSSSLSLNELYELGKMQRQAPFAQQDIPVKTGDTEMFKFPVAVNCGCYYEIQVQTNFTIGSHVLLIGRMVYAKHEEVTKPSAYHIHFFQSLKSGYAG